MIHSLTHVCVNKQRLHIGKWFHINLAYISINFRGIGFESWLKIYWLERVKITSMEKEVQLCTFGFHGQLVTIGPVNDLVEILLQT